MFLGRLIPRLSREWIQEVRKDLTGEFLGQVLIPETSSAAGGPGNGGRSGRVNHEVNEHTSWNNHWGQVTRIRDLIGELSAGCRGDRPSDNPPDNR